MLIELPLQRLWHLGDEFWLGPKGLVAGGWGLGLGGVPEEAGAGGKGERKEEGAKALNSKAHYSASFERQEQDSL